MSLRRALLIFASLAFSLVLIALLIRVGKIDLRTMLRQLQSVSPVAFAKLVLLNALLILISTQRWRSVDAVLRRSSDSPASKTAAFTMTSVGMALGLVLPVQLGMTAARTLGTYVYGSALKRGTIGSLFEQSFDVLIVVFLAIGSLATWFFRGGAVTWTISALVMTAVALLAVGPAISLVRWLASRAASNTSPSARMQKLLRALSELVHSGLLNTGLARRLTALSALRFVVVVLMAGQTADAVGIRIPLWHFAAAIPFVVITTLIAVTPGGIGVNELTSTAALTFFGTPLAIGAQWALTNRLLGMAACFAVAGCAAAMLAMRKIAAAVPPGETARPL